MWRAAGQLTDFPDKFAVPMLLCSGWFDHYPSDVIRAFTDMQAMSNAGVRTAHKLIMGPWSHSALGDPEQGELLFPEAAGVPLEAGRRFLDYYLLGAKNRWPLEPAVRSFVMGDNTWRSGATWPVAPLAEKTLYLRRGGLLLTTPEPPTMPPLDFPPDTIAADPRNPSPTVGGSRFDPFDKTTTVGPYDQRALVESRNDVLVYSTPEMTSPELLIDARAELMVSSDALDTDFSLRLCDVYPDGRSMLLTQGIRRLRFRDGYDKESAYTPGGIVPITIELSPTPVVFETGHKLRIIISSANSPMFDVNLNNGGAMYAAGDTVTARNLVHHTASDLSRLVYRTEAVTAAGHTPQPASLHMKLWPNPIPGSGWLSLEAVPPATIHVDVFDMLGRCVQSLPAIDIDAGQSTVPVNLSALPAGLYLFRARSAHGTASVAGRVVKQ
jgi:putative CocE/NonD family hydrolase